jgi:mono/diheme cytochrome c family protein
MAAGPATNRSAKRSRRSKGFQLAAAIVLTLAAVLPSAAADEAAVARGAYLAAAAGCDGCHTDTKNGGAPFAGGRAMATEFGTITTPNITPDATGIGGWSLVDFIRAMRWGITPDGTHYVTAFPFPYFARMTDGDLTDLKAYLDSLTPVTRPDTGRADSLALLARARAAIGVALMPVAALLPYKAANPDTDVAVARGAYLVATVGRCGDCHTPRTSLGAPDPSRELAGSKGGIIEGKRAPNITPDAKTGIGGWSKDDILYLLKVGGTPDGDFVGGSMAEIVRNTARLTDDDRCAIAAYLKVLPAKALDKNK